MPDDTSLTGRMLGRYRVLEKVGQGGMGVVYRAQDTRLNRDVALKLIHPSLLKDEEARRRFVREAQAASALTHPNICTIHSIEEEEGQLFLVLEFLEGQTLKEKAPELRSNWKSLLDCVIQAAEGLAEAHRRNVVHRDIKPANLWVTPRGLVKIMDFGLAKQIRPPRPPSESDDTSDATAIGVAVGTTQYMSPEQARGREVDTRSDIFSFGIVLHEVATGSMPFTGGSNVEVFERILNFESPPPSHLRPEIPAEFDRMVVKALRKDPNERYQSAADLAVDLKMLRREMDSGPHTPPPSSASAPALQPPGAVPAEVPAVAGAPCPVFVHHHSTLRSAVLILVAIATLVGLTLLGVTVMSSKKAAAPVVAPSGRPTVAVLTFENRTGDASLAWYGTNAAELLAVELTKMPNVDVISKQRIYDVLRELKMSEKMPTLDANVATEVARKSNATIMVRGDTLKLSGTVILKAEAVEVSSGRVLAAERVSEVTEKNMLSKVDELGELLREKLKAVK